MIDVNRLVLLRELDARQSVAGVARLLGVSPSAVSQQLRKLESETGTQLTQQQGRSLSLTPAGRRLVQHAESVLEILETAEAELDASRRAVHGIVRMSGFNSFARARLPALLATVRRLYPEVEITFTQAEPDEALNAVAARRCDIAITDEFPQMPRRLDRSLQRTHLLQDRVIPCFPGEDEPHAPAATEQPWVLEPDGTEAHLWALRVCRAAGFEPHVVFESPDPAVHLDLVRAGVAAAFIPQMVLDLGRDRNETTDAANVAGGGTRARASADSGGWVARGQRWTSGLPGLSTLLRRDVYAVTRSSAASHRATAAVLEQLCATAGPVAFSPGAGAHAPRR